MKKILYFFLTISLLYSCSPLDKEIIKSTAGNDILEIKKNLTDKDSLKIYTLDNILAMSEGYNSYLKN